MDLKIYVTKHCWGCKAAKELAVQTQQTYPGLNVNVIDLNGTDARKPEEVFATPTYLLNGRVVSLGNPKPERLRELIESELESH